MAGATTPSTANISVAAKVTPHGAVAPTGPDPDAENARLAAEIRAELAERDALWAKYPHEMSALEGAELALFDASPRGRRRAEERLARARAALEAAKARMADVTK